MDEVKTKYGLMRVEFADDKLPKFTEGKGQDDMVSFGEDNNWPMHLIDLFNRSSKHNAIVTGKAAMIKGDGLKSDGAPNASLTKFLEHPNKFENANDILEKVAIDLELHGGFYLQLVWSKAGDKIIAMYHAPFEEMRCNKKCTKFARKEKWDAYQRTQEKEKYDVFNPLNENRKGKTQIFYYKIYRPGLKTYPLPDYIGARQYVETDTEISNFHYNNIKNAWSDGTIVTFVNGEPPSDEEVRKIRKALTRKQGTDNAGGLTLNFADKPDQAPVISRTQPDEMDKQYLQLYQTATDEIFIGHRVTSPMIFGVRTAGQLGGRQELMEAKEVFYTDYVKGKVSIIERAFNYLLEFIAPGSKVIIEKGDSADNAGATNTANTGAQEQKMGKQLTEDDILALFESHGEPESNYRIIKSRKLRFGAEPGEDEDELNAFQMKVFFAQPLNIEINDAQKKVLEVIKENPRLTEAAISDLTDLSPVEVNKALKYLVDEGVLRINSDGGSIDITDRGLKTIDEKNLITTEIFVKYSYDGPQDDRNRPFCARILKMGRLYTREDIDKISEAAGYNVWTQRGGWYHNPKTSVNTPYCRHYFSQKIVKRKVRVA